MIITIINSANIPKIPINPIFPRNPIFPSENPFKTIIFNIKTPQIYNLISFIHLTKGFHFFIQLGHKLSLQSCLKILKLLPRI